MNQRPQQPAHIGSYRISGPLGHGGMGIVYDAVHVDTGRRAALKMLRHADPTDEQLRRFQREVDATATLDHPNIVAVLDSGMTEDGAWYAMDYIEGQPLNLWAKERSREDRLATLLVIAGAIGHAHERGVLHRDIKPDNILIDGDGVPHVTDFGLARLMDSDSSLTRSSDAVGTPAYMSPEQAQGYHAECGPSSDVWALGVIAYEMSVGTRPFQGETALDFMKAIVEHDPAPPQRIDPTVSAELQAVILHSLEKEPGRRYQTAAEFAEDLQRALAGKSIAVGLYDTIFFVRRWLLRRVGVILLAASIALGVALGLWYAVQSYQDRWGIWTEAFSWSSAQLDTHGLIFTDNDAATPVEPWRRGEYGLVMPATHWCWVAGTSITGDVRVEARVRTFDRLDGIELCLNAAPPELPLSREWMVPTSYSAQVGGYAGFIDFISVNREPQKARVSHAAESSMRPHTTHTIVFEREGQRLRLSVDGELIKEVHSTLPLVGDRLGRVGIRRMYTKMELVSLEVSRLASPKAPGPFTAADTMLRMGHPRSAFEEYRTMATAYEDRDIVQQALLRAWLLGLEYGAENTDLRTIRHRLDAVAEPAVLALAAAGEALQRWEDGDYTEALALVAEILELDPNSEVVLECLALGHSSLDHEQTARLLELVGRTRKVAVLQLRDAGIRDLAPLTGSDITVLDLSGNPIADLTPLATSRVRRLSLERCGIQDVSGLRGAALTELSLAGNPIRDIEPLRGMSLTHLDLSETEVGDLSPLAGMSLTSLRLNHSRVEDLGPVLTKPLQTLAISGLSFPRAPALRHQTLQVFLADDCGMEDLSLLAGQPLVSVSISRNPVSDLSSLESGRLRQFNAIGCGLQRLPDWFAHQPLTRVMLSGNRLEHLPPLPQGLDLLAVNHNQLAEPPSVIPPICAIQHNPLADFVPLAGHGHVRYETDLTRLPPRQAVIEGLEHIPPEQPLHRDLLGILAVLDRDPTVLREHAFAIGDRLVAVATVNTSYEGLTAFRAESGLEPFVPADQSECLALAAALAAVGQPAVITGRGVAQGESWGGSEPATEPSAVMVHPSDGLVLIPVGTSRPVAVVVPPAP